MQREDVHVTALDGPAQQTDLREDAEMPVKAVSVQLRFRATLRTPPGDALGNLNERQLGSWQATGETSETRSTADEGENVEPLLVDESVPAQLPGTSRHRLELVTEIDWRAGHDRPAECGTRRARASASNPSTSLTDSRRTRRSRESSRMLIVGSASMATTTSASRTSRSRGGRPR